MLKYFKNYNLKPFGTLGIFFGQNSYINSVILIILPRVVFNFI